MLQKLIKETDKFYHYNNKIRHNSLKILGTLQLDILNFVCYFFMFLILFHDNV